MSHRLTDGGAIDRSRRLSFSFDGKAYGGFAGDTLAAALLANDVKLVGRSFKYHRPRGVFSAGPEEPNALVELGVGAKREPNTKATTVELFEGLAATSQNRFPSLSFDLGAVNSLLSPFFGAGFYYKTFMWPAAFWEKLYEPAIRRAAGMGKASAQPDPDHYDKSHAFCDLLVIGAGPAGLMAALVAGEAGARVILCDEDFLLGGRLLSERHEIDGADGAAWARATVARLESMPNVRIFRRTSVFGVYDSGTYGAVERVTDHLPSAPHHLPRQRFWKIVARRSVLAAGAIERPIIFGGNDRPGVMLAASARSYVNRFAVSPAKSLAVFTTGDDGWKTVADFAARGVPVAAVVDTRRELAPDFVTLAKRIGARLVLGGRVINTAGGKALKSVEVAGLDTAALSVSIDCLAVSGGWNPTIGLSCHHGSRPKWSDSLSAYLADMPPPGMVVAGAAAGQFALPDVLRSGATAGQDAAKDLGFAAASPAVPKTSDDPTALAPFWYVKDSRGKAFVDLQNDVSDSDIKIAYREGYRSVEHLKRYTTLGMGTDQGKTANVGGQAIMATLTGAAQPVAGTVISRPPQTPVAIAALAGHHRGKQFRPARPAPSHDFAVERGAAFIETGLWLRAQYFPQPGEKDWLATVTREVNTVRSKVGVVDASTFGKIDIQGKDAAAFLDRVYINTFSTLAIGKARYGVMLREDGFVMDDGTVARLGPEHFSTTTTTVNAGPVMQHLEYCRQILWPELDVQLASISETWAQFAVAGPRSRDTLAKLVDAPFDIAAFPHMGAAELTVCGGVPARLFRLSFSGELAFELAVPADYGDGIIRAIVAAGEEFGITPYGSESLGVMRVEKGHVAGNELTGQMTARDLGLGKMMSTKKDYIGRRMAERAAFRDPERPVVVGFKPVDKAARLYGGAHFLGIGAKAVIENDEGFMSSVAFSPTLGHWIGMGFLRRGAERMGQRVRAVDSLRGSDVEVEICSPVFVDPEGAKLRG